MPMSELSGHIVHVVILIAMIATSWVLPRTFGLLGLIGAHFCGVIGLVSMGYVSLASGIWPAYDDPLVIFGLILQGMVFNVLMLPLSVWAMIRWRRLSPMSRLYDPQNATAAPNVNTTASSG